MSRTSPHLFNHRPSLAPRKVHELPVAVGCSCSEAANTRPIRGISICGLPSKVQRDIQSSRHHSIMRQSVCRNTASCGFRRTGALGSGYTSRQGEVASLGWRRSRTTFLSSACFPPLFQNRRQSHKEFHTFSWGKRGICLQGKFT